MGDFFTQEKWLGVYESLLEWVITELPFILLLTVFVFILLRLLSFLTKRIKKIVLHRARKSDPVREEEIEKRTLTLLGTVKGVVKISIWSIFIMLLLAKFGINLGPILAGAGIVGLAIGFGAQELVRDFISGFFILLENQIRKGDYVIINGTAGEVESIELRTTTIRDLSGNVHIFQNGKMNTITNMTKEWSSIVLEIGVAYKENVDHVIKVLNQAGKQLLEDPEYGEKVLEPVLVMGLDKFADSALVIKVRIKTTPGNQWAIGRAYRKYVKEYFDKEHIEIPFPHRTIYFGADNAKQKENLKQFVDNKDI